MFRCLTRAVADSPFTVRTVRVTDWSAPLWVSVTGAGHGLVNPNPWARQVNDTVTGPRYQPAHDRDDLLETRALIDGADTKPASSSTLFVIPSMAYALPARSTVTPVRLFSPVNGTVTCWSDDVAPAGRAVTRRVARAAR